MRQYKLCIQIIIIVIKKRIKIKRKASRRNDRVRGERVTNFFYFFHLFASFSDLWKSDCRSL